MRERRKIEDVSLGKTITLFFSEQRKIFFTDGEIKKSNLLSHVCQKMWPRCRDEKLQRCRKHPPTLNLLGFKLDLFCFRKIFRSKTRKYVFRSRPHKQKRNFESRNETSVVSSWRHEADFFVTLDSLQMRLIKYGRILVH